MAPGAPVKGFFLGPNLLVILPDNTGCESNFISVLCSSTLSLELCSVGFELLLFGGARKPAKSPTAFKPCSRNDCFAELFKPDSIEFVPPRTGFIKMGP